MKSNLIILLLFFISNVYGQESVRLDEKGAKLQQFYLSLDVENNWLSGHHVTWDTGQPDMPESRHGNKTHCSAFAAAACGKLSIYLLRPPEHGQILLANAQYDWLKSVEGLNSGWKAINSPDRYLLAQQYANNGRVVIAVYQNSDRSKPGHIALVMPKERSAKILEEEGPELIMAGTHNFNFISLKNGFKSHIQSWPENKIEFYLQDKMPVINN